MLTGLSISCIVSSSPQEAIPGATSLEAEAQSTWSHGGPSALAVGADPTAPSGVQAANPPPALNIVDGKDLTEEEAAHLAPPAPQDHTGGTTTRPGLGERHHSVRDKMEPHLQLMAGPMLVYHTVKEGIWYGAAMVVTADAGSVMDPRPCLNLSWSPSSPTDLSDLTDKLSLGTKPAVPDATADRNGQEQNIDVPGESIYVYHGPQGSFTFTRFPIAVPLTETSVQVRYRVNRGTQLNFWVPGKNEPLRWAAHSCNGFSAGVDPEPFYNHDKFSSGYDPVWEDLLDKHQEKPFHCMVGGGDQIYCDRYDLDLIPCSSPGIELT